jgi:hypothetical protein
MDQHSTVLTRSEVDRFVEVGYVRVEQAIPSQIAQDCRDLAIERLAIPASAPWPGPVVRGLVEGEPFREAANAPLLIDAVGQLLEGERWQRRPNLGLLVVRFPSREDAGDTGWHIDASFQGPTTDTLFDWYVNHRSEGRGLLLLCLLSDVTADDAPTRILEGSHHAMPPLLRPFGDDGVMGLSAPLPEPEGSATLATGLAGDVYLCHPFLVHAASWPHVGTQPRLIAQPPIALDGALHLEGPDEQLSPVALAVRRALDA